MGRFYDKIPDEDSEYFDWIKDQKMFWVATAPISSQGHVNVSPKGMFPCSAVPRTETPQRVNADLPLS